MSDQRKTRSNPTREDPDLSEESVPKKLRSHNKPGKKESAPGPTPPGATGTSETGTRPKPSSYQSSAYDILSGAASALFATQPQQKEKETVTEETVEEKKATPGLSPWNSPEAPAARQSSGTTSPKLSAAAAVIRRPQSTPPTRSGAEFTTPRASPSPPAQPTPSEDTPEDNPVTPEDPAGTEDDRMAADQAMQAMQAQLNTVLNDIKVVKDKNKELEDKLKNAQPKKEVATQEVKIPTFEGTKDSRSAEAWWAKADSIAKQNEWEDQRFIETATSVLTKEAEEWVVYLKDQQAMFMGTTVLTDKAVFKTAFLQQFSKSKSIAGQTQTLLT